MPKLPKGANAPLTSSGSTRLEVYWDQTKGSAEVLCLAVDERGRVPSDDWFIFYNQPQSPEGLIRLQFNDPGRVEFRLQLDVLPTSIHRCVCAAALEQGRFRDLVGLRLIATPTFGEPLVFELTEAEDEQALILAECYRHGPGWKLRAVGQGYRGGLRALAEHFGVAVIDETPAPAPAPLPPSPPPAEQPSPSPVPPPPPIPDRQPAGRRRRTWMVWAFVSIVLIGGALGAAGLWAPQWFTGLGRFVDELSARLHPQLLIAPAYPPAASDTGLPARPEPAGMRSGTFSMQTAACTWTDEEMFKRYHALGENYVRILQRVESSNKQLLKWRKELRQLSDAPCPASFIEGNRQELEQLKQLPVSEWLDESLKLNVCAGLMIKRVDKELNQETRPLISQRLVREADRARNLESDLTDIARDLAYLRNKTERLIGGLQENLDACGR
ncbi:stress protein [Caldichromatium japonicum]|uniref:Stress protein n=1 Tax=Caldichromatium japonicum TaxID=2699430 RepID=A0A6G7VB32_9GAMM|nr:TerD family protein [Caldichromatium japonicum]QIK37076.1 stress protein [Caldichromatium japonicum]